jgi:hypothetical protein
MRFRVLGPLLVHDRDKELEISAPRLGVLLAALLVRAR